MRFESLYTFISPVTGRILSTKDYVLVGNRNGVAVPSPILIDLRLDLINLRRDYNVLSLASFVVGFPNTQLPNAQVLNALNDGYMFNTAGIVSTTPTIPIGGLPDLTYNKVWVGNVDNRPEERDFPGGGAAPADATYIVRQANGSLPNAQALQDLGTGIAKVVANGFVAIAIAGDDYVTPDQLDNAIDDLQSQIDDLQSQIDDLQSQIDDLDDDIIVIEGEIAIIEGEIASLFASIAVIEGEIATLTAAIVAVNARIDNLRLNNIPADDNVSFYNYRLINLANPINPQDGTTKYYVDNAISGIPSSTILTLTGNVIGSGPLSAPVSTILNMTLDEIPIPVNTVNMNFYRIENLQQSPEGDFDAISTTFLWDLIHDRVDILWL